MATSGWARWGAAARTPRAPSPGSRRTCAATTCSASRRCGSRSATRPPSLYNNRTQLHAALEFACLDIIGQKLGVPVHALLGGKLRDRVEFASYLFFRYANPATGQGEVRTAEQLVAHARELKAQHGFRSHKLKGGVFPPAHELACYQALAAAFPGEGLRHDPNSAWSMADAIRFAQRHRGAVATTGSRIRSTASRR